MRPRHLALVPALALLLAACTSGGASPPVSATTSSPSPVVLGSPAAQTMEVKVSDALRIEPAEMTFRAGRPIRFVVTNTGSTNHEFYLGDQAAQEAHGMEMASSMGAMAHDEPEGIGLKPGETKELTFTFPKAGTFLAGCHVNGHYGGGMKAAITITE
jgi:uncharacterized cupredoxin-like copper-binding protein